MMTTLKKTSVAAVVFMILLALTTLAGCGSTPKIRAYNAEQVFTVTVESLNTYKEIGLIDDDQWANDVLPLIESGDVILDLLAADILSNPNDPTAGATTLQSLSALTGKLVKVRLLLETGDK